MRLKSIPQQISMLAVFGLLPSAFAVETTKKIELLKEGTQLIGQLEETARDLHHNADQLASLSRNTQISKWSHYDHLEQIKLLVNDDLGPALSRLTEIQPELPSWKSQAIGQMLDSARSLAADTELAFLRQNEHGSRPVPLNTEYIDLVNRINEHAESLVEIADAAGDYATAHLKASEAGLNVPKS
jgi:hypothetical protein